MPRISSQGNSRQWALKPKVVRLLSFKTFPTDFHVRSNLLKNNRKNSIDFSEFWRCQIRVCLQIQPIVIYTEQHTANAPCHETRCADPPAKSRHSVYCLQVQSQEAVKVKREARPIRPDRVSLFHFAGEWNFHRYLPILPDLRGKASPANAGVMKNAFAHIWWWQAR